YELYEVEYYNKRLTGASQKLAAKNNLKPVKDYFRAQGRFRAITDAQIEDIQNQLNAKWDHYSQIPVSDV
ncbi:MAG TPA: hypothetical protein PK874_13910, partial [Desulfobacteraceae bacterium]|nr:hypothetical protein [Desulfobacteraceae bacterium]